MPLNNVTNSPPKKGLAAYREKHKRRVEHAVEGGKVRQRQYCCGSTSQPMAALLPRAGEACISVDQLVLKAHKEFNKRFETAPSRQLGAAPRICSYCKGVALPAHTDRRTCPQRAADEAAAEATAPAVAASTAAAGGS